MGRTVTDRWFSWPWRPWKRTRIYTPRIPDPNVYRMNNEFGNFFVMHSETLYRLQQGPLKRHIYVR